MTVQGLGLGEGFVREGADVRDVNFREKVSGGDIKGQMPYIRDSTELLYSVFSCHQARSASLTRTATCVANDRTDGRTCEER